LTDLTCGVVMAQTPSGSAARVDPEGYRNELAAELEHVVLPAIVARLEMGAAVPPPVELARRMLAVAPTATPRNKMADQVGPEFYDTAAVMVVLAGPGGDPISRQAVEHRRKRRTVLALQTSDRRWIYPTWQFVDHDVLPGLPELLAAFGEHPGWSVATWLTTPQRALDGSTAVDWLHEGRDRPLLMLLARRTASRWAA